MYGFCLKAIHLLFNCRTPFKQKSYGNYKIYQVKIKNKSALNEKLFRTC